MLCSLPLPQRSSGLSIQTFLLLRGRPLPPRSFVSHPVITVWIWKALPRRQHIPKGDGKAPVPHLKTSHEHSSTRARRKCVLLARERTRPRSRTHQRALYVAALYWPRRVLRGSRANKKKRCVAFLVQRVQTRVIQTKTKRVVRFCFTL
jgi:hypothetical protein